MRLFLWVKREILHVVPVFIFFLIAFTVIDLNERFLFKRAGMPTISFLEVVLAAGVVAKVFLVIDHLRLVDLFKDKPLIHNVLWKTFFYWLILMAVRLTTHLIPYLFWKEGFKQDVEAFAEHFNWRLFISVQVYYLLLLGLFTTFRELSRAIGPDKMRKLFFGNHRTAR